MLSKQALMKQVCLDRSCECSFLPLSSHQNSKENLFLAAISSTYAGRYQQVLRQKPTKNKARKSLKPHKIEKENRISNYPSEGCDQLKFISSNSLLADPIFQDHERFSSYNQKLCRKPLSIIQNLAFVSSNSSNIVTTKQESVEPKVIQQTVNNLFIKKNPLQIRYSSNYPQKKEEVKGTTDIKVVKLDRAQSSGSFFIPKLNLRKTVVNGGVQWRSQFINAQLEKSVSKLTHRLTDLNVKCTESINDEESLRISEVVSDSEGERSDTNRTETLPKRIKNLMHMKYSKMEGKKY